MISRTMSCIYLIRVEFIAYSIFLTPILLAFFVSDIGKQNMKSTMEIYGSPFYTLASLLVT